MKLKRCISLIAATVCSLSLISSVSAFYLSDGTEVEMDDPIVVEYRQELIERGLSEQNIRSLANHGFHLDEMVMLTDAQLTALLGENLGRTIMPRISTYTVTNIPDELYGSTSDFVVGSGMTDGDFYIDNEGYYIEEQVDSFSENAIPYADSYNNMYYLFGEYDPSIGVHQGVDIQPDPKASSIYSRHSGVVVRANGTFGEVGIYNASRNRTYYYLHMKDITFSVGQTVAVGDLLGTCSSVGLPNKNSIHLHFEVRNGRNTSIGNGEGTTLTSLYPYDHMA